METYLMAFCFIQWNTKIYSLTMLLPLSFFLVLSTNFDWRINASLNLTIIDSDMANGPNETKTVSKPMLHYCELDDWEQISVKIQSIYSNFHTKNVLEIAVCEMAVILARLHCVKTGIPEC